MSVEASKMLSSLRFKTRSCPLASCRILEWATYPREAHFKALQACGQALTKQKKSWWPQCVKVRAWTCPVQCASVAATSSTTQPYKYMLVNPAEGKCMRHMPAHPLPQEGPMPEEKSGSNSPCAPPCAGLAPLIADLLAREAGEPASQRESQQASNAARGETERVRENAPPSC